MMKSFSELIHGNKKEKPAENQISTATKWIQVDLEISFSDKVTKKKITEIANDISTIILNTHALMNLKNECLGVYNPYLKQNAVLTYEKMKNIQDFTISRKFYPTYQKIKGGWKLIFFAVDNWENHQIDLYSLERFAHESCALNGAVGFIAQKYNLGSDAKMYSKPIVMEGEPCVESHLGMYKLSYNIRNRMASAKNNPELDKKFLGNGVETVSEFINAIEKEKLNPQWTKLIKKLLKKGEKNEKHP